VEISPIEQPEKNNFGYYVRIKRQGKQYAKFFTDREHGCKRKALQPAQQSYKELVKQMPLEFQIGRKSVRNSSGYVGVSRTKSTRRGHTYKYWQAWWGSGEERRSVKFSIKKYGSRKAKQLAIQARQEWEWEWEARPHT
jgi:AP2 domain